MTPFDKFTFPALRPSRRRTLLSHVMPVDDAVAYFAVLTEGYLHSNTGERRIASFQDVTDWLGTDDALTALLEARRRGQLTEGDHALPRPVVDCLCGVSNGVPLVRYWVTGEPEPTIATASLTQVNRMWPGLDFEEAEVVDPDGNWYFRFKDDDALTFLAARGDLLCNQLRQCRAYCREAAGHVMYAP